MPRPRIPPNFPVCSPTTIAANARRAAVGQEPWWPQDCETVARRRFIVRQRGLTRVVLNCNCENCRARFTAFADLVLGTIDGGPPEPIPPREQHQGCDRCGRRRNRSQMAHDPNGYHVLCRACQPNPPAQPVTVVCQQCTRSYRAPADDPTPTCIFCGHIVGQPIMPTMREHSYRPPAKVFSADNERKNLPLARPRNVRMPVFTPPQPPDPADTPPTRGQPVPVPEDQLRAGYFTLSQFHNFSRPIQMEYWRSWRDRIAHRREMNNLHPPTITTQPLTGLFLGCELEVEMPTNARPPEILKAVDDVAEGLTYYKRDGSLSNGAEIVTHPFTEAWYRSHGKGIFDKLSAALRAQKCRSHTPGTCGFHIHLTKSAFSNLHLYKFTKLWLSNLRAVEIISQRQTEHLNRWAKLDLRDLTTVGQIARSKRGGGDRYVAVNVAEHTVELRAFRGNTKPERIHKNIECALATFHFTKTAPITQLTWPHFTAWAKERPKQYPHLVPFLVAHLETDTIVREPADS